MGQQPNIELDPADRPRAVPEPDPPRRWKPTRPGTITAPDQVPRGRWFGRPGPDIGWAYRLVRLADIPGRTPELEAVLVTLMGARSSFFGRAPVPEDLEVAMLLVGLGEGLPDHIGEQRDRWLEVAAHERHPGETALAEVDHDLLLESTEHVRYVLTRT